VQRGTGTIDLTTYRGERTVSFLGSAGRRGAALLRHRGITATAGAAALVVISGGTFAAVTHRGPNHETIASAGNTSASNSRPAAQAKPAHPAEPLRVVSVSPGNSRGVNGAAPIKVTFSSALSPQTPLPTLSPKIAGSWRVSGDTVTFTPAVGYQPGTRVTLKIPGGKAGVTGAGNSAGVLGKSETVSFTTGSFSTLRLQQLLAELGYLPLTWTPASPDAPAIPDGDANAQLSAAYDPPAGTFTFQSGYPAELTSQWRTGEDNMLDVGAIRAFENNQGLAMDGVAGPAVWAHLFTAIARHQVNPDGYTYALATQGSSNESLQVWHDGRRILDTPANTGIPASPTADGTFPVYERLQFQIMKGTNPDGTKYADPVSWIAYFNGGDAVHGFYRAGYGWYQSLGCVELPPATAKYIWPYLTYGTLVTVRGPVA
jgi:peptidoglycan hydrolase-like protein with peptidoglycan-binding domain